MRVFFGPLKVIFMTLQQKRFVCTVRFRLFAKMWSGVFGLESQWLSNIATSFPPGVFHLLWCSDACNMALNREFSFANRAAGLSNSKIWKWKIEHRSLPAYNSASAYPFCIHKTYKIKAQFGYKYSRLTDFPWVGNTTSNLNHRKWYMLHTFLFMEHCWEKN